MKFQEEKEKIDDPITYRIIGCAMKVHSTLGNGFQEIIYQRALEIELKNSGLSFKKELEMPIFYLEERIGMRRVDFLIENSIMLELKALTKMEDVHLAQGLNYLVAFKVDKGLLINFGSKSLEVKRLRHPKNKMPGTIPKSNHP
jgi:GxxExxY protein